ncbi:MAG: DUF4249 domain-containing protein [Bacteroidetes bacterium]|nr:MAG: DUF4249 domain-containing protein [Bacteroidota bacterium]
MKININKTIRNLSFIAVATFFLASCTERIEIELDTTYSRLVIEGQVTTETTSHWVNLSWSTDYYNPAAPVGISNAIVTIFDGFDIITLEESETQPGLYETAPDFFGLVGRTYSLNIDLAEPINEISNFTASSELKYVAPIDSITLGYRDRFHATEVKIYALDPPSEDFYTFNIIKNNILITDTINKVGITDDRFFNNNYTNGAPVYFLRDDEPAEKVYPGDTITLQMSGVTKEYYEFISDIQLETFDFSNPLFSGPPANISTNLSEGAIGFFAAFSSSYATVVATEIVE